jgi:GTPase SAR1 family protein
VQTKNVLLPGGKELIMDIECIDEDRNHNDIELLFELDTIHCMVLVYSLDDFGSFETAKKWVRMLEEHGKQDQVVRFLVGNKSDLPRDEWKVTPEIAIEYAESNRMEYFETSAL